MPKISIDLASGKIEKSHMVIGIDLGTTNSLIAGIDSETGNPYCFGKDGDSIIPSTIHFTGDKVLVGQEALELRVKEPENSVYSVKRLMGKSFHDLQESIDFFNYDIIDMGDDQLIKVKIRGQQYNPIELSSLILKELKSLAEKRLKAEIKKVVISVPAYFNDAQRQATRDAGKLAGLDVLRIINEPTAASLAYGLGLKQEERNTVAVYDLGGGTFDISVLRIQQGIFEVISTNGDTFLGGDDFDQSIVNFWKQEQRVTWTKSDLQLLRLIAEKAKKKLSEQKKFEEEIQFENGSRLLTIGIEQLNELIKPLIDRTIKACEAALKDAKMTIDEIDEVIMVGGSTRILAVQNRVKALFYRSHINTSINPDEVVALGTAIEADILAGNRKDILLLDVTPLSLGLETLGGLMDVLIPRNTKIPTKLSRQYTTSVDGQVNMKIGIFQGERDMVKDNRKIGEFELKGIPSMPAGFPKIEVSFMLDADGILKVAAQELRSGVGQEIVLKPQFGLEDREIEQMLRDSISFANEDMEQRNLAEARIEAKQLVFSTEKFLVDNEEIIDEESVGRIKRLMEQILKAIDANDRGLIVKLTDELNDTSRPFAEKAMDKAISKALKGKQV